MIQNPGQRLLDDLGWNAIVSDTAVKIYHGLSVWVQHMDMHRWLLRKS